MSATASPEANTAMVMRYYEEPWEQGQVEVLDELHTPEFVGHVPGMPDYDLDGLRALVLVYRRAFTDFKIDSEDVIATDDAVVVRWRSRGRFTGDFIGRPPTGELVTTTGITIYRFLPGRIAEHWTEYDSLGLMSAVGALPSAD